ncbi:hypothetical protein [Ramlibacter algicola]|uniref:Uncharacterized protein n=1 Tax=Ramlibacter algicola TaxID=2795217 RepID=A0A934PVL4_9BURK|nr:hypothetical protein [Ramlibacter algicola]MBK0391280.1 hypothetical protein [Ramlibacter algicola]
MRFEPDSWLDAVLRPLAMAAPDANVYVEAMAPDFRFVFALGLLLVLAVIALRKRAAGAGTTRAAGARPVLLLAAALALAFVPWLATTGNGRYFVVALLAVGPLCVGLAQLIPMTRAARLALVAGMVAVQAFAVIECTPWRVWGMVAWKEAPYFQVDVPREWRDRPATIVTLAPLTYSLLAPQFHPQSRWASLYNAPPPDSRAQDAKRTRDFLARAQSGPLLVLAPVLDGMATAASLPTAEMTRALDGELAPYRLALISSDACRFLAAPQMASMRLGQATPEQRARAGFWLCTLEAKAVTTTPREARDDAVFRALEAQCPRFFPAGGDGQPLRIPHGYVRSYLQSEMKAYVYEDGQVFYKYYRALNPVQVGSTADVLAGKARVDCAAIRGRSGLPWEREI